MLKPESAHKNNALTPAATFGWLCVETSPSFSVGYILSQPPSGGCVLKQQIISKSITRNLQPPSGGCVLKHIKPKPHNVAAFAATFGWLCVETGISIPKPYIVLQPPSGGCVLKQNTFASTETQRHAATFGWLCVETVN